MRFITGVLLILVGLVALGCGTEGDPTGGFVPREMEANQVMFDVHHYLHEDGTVRALLLADTAFVYEDDGIIDARQIDVTMYGDRGEKSGRLTALSGEIRTDSEAMTARGEVVLVTVEGDRRIETEELHYDPDRGRIWSEVESTLIEDGTVTTGTGFTADTGLRTVRITNPQATGLRVPLRDM